MSARILLVEDDPFVSRGILTYIQKQNDLSVELVPTAEDAIAAVRREQWSIIILDLMLAGFSSGHYLVQAIKHFPDDDRPRVIVITGAPVSEIAKVDRSVAHAIFFKPLQFDAFAHYVHHLATAADPSVAVDPAPERIPISPVTKPKDV
ncbi:MAG: response regulator [Thermoanaerobaculia bacterium]